MMKLTTTLPLVLALFASPAFASPPSLETVLSKHLDAQGGVARLKAVNSVVMVSSDTFDGKTTTYSSQKLRPNLWRTEFSDGASVVVKGFDGQAGWFSKDGAVELVAADKVEKMKKNTIDDPLLDPAARGWKVELAGTESVDGAPAHVLVMTHRDGDVQRRYIDAKSYLEVKRVSTFSYDGKTMEKTAKFSNFKTINGITVATTTEYTKDGRKGSYTLTKIEFDAPLKVTAFAPPAGAKAPAVQAASAK